MPVGLPLALFLVEALNVPRIVPAGCLLPHLYGGLFLALPSVPQPDFVVMAVYTMRTTEAPSVVSGCITAVDESRKVSAAR